MTPRERAWEIVNRIVSGRLLMYSETVEAIAQAITDTRDEALEEAAKECDRMADATPGHTNVFAHNLAISIRALKRKDGA